MRWFVGAKSTKSLSIVTAVAVGIGLLVNIPRTVSANTDIYTFVCNEAMTSGSTVNITNPQSDRTVTNSNVTISGTVNVTSSIEVYIDDVYNSTVPIGLAQETFSTTVSLNVGTHTIKLYANPTCGSEVGTDEIVLTMRDNGNGNPPANPPGKPTGGTTTNVGDQPDQAGQSLDLAGTPKIEIDKGPSTGLWPVDLIIEQSRGNPLAFTAYSLTGVVGVFVIWRSLNTLGITKGVLDSKYINRLFFRKKP
ncbi:MAG: hypothetical protein WBB94_04405 [Candidatus Saccharimonadaceae bacterium]